ncbi:MAG: cell filamentation protein Fic, partial [Prevotellaceae bacterium]|nr:cell filamentation protein Fic [Prevotellaceae bacterium]
MAKYERNMEGKDNFLIYNTPNNDVRVDVYLHNETVWLTQKAMAALFDVEVNTINYHLKEIYKTGELQ